MDNQNSLGTSEERRTKFLDALRMSQPSKEMCSTYFEDLSDYIDAQLAEEDYLTRFAAVALHLDSCEACADAYARLYEVELAIQTNQLSALEQIPEPNLSFLDGLNPASVEKMVGDLLAEAFVATANSFRLELSQALLSLLRPATPVALTRAANEDERYSKVLVELNSEAFPALDLPINLTAFADSQNPELCLVEIVVRPEGKSWPELGGYAVRVQTEETQQTETTDAWGVTAFVDIAVAHLETLVVEVSY